MFSQFLAICERAARAGGQTLRDWQGRVSPKEKALKDFVTEADFASQETIRGIVLGRYPDHRFLGEESDPSVEGAKDSSVVPERGRPRLESEYRWIVDPLDGTANYIRGIPSFAVSVALEGAAGLLVGTIYDPTSDECFTAVRGGGAYLNGRPIRTRNCVRLRDALLAVSFSAHVPRGSAELQQFTEVLHECQGIRRLGSAALNLAYVACGRLDGYYTEAVKIWDVAAGVLLVTEAGGTLSGIAGQPFQLEQPHLACAGTGALHAELVAILQQAE